jgi:hypothetical protein
MHPLLSYFPHFSIGKLINVLIDFLTVDGDIARAPLISFSDVQLYATR